MYCRVMRPVTSLRGCHWPALTARTHSTVAEKTVLLDSLTIDGV